MIMRMKFFVKWIMVILFFVAFSPCVFAMTIQNTQSVIGYWKTFDGKTKKLSSIIGIKQQGQFFTGKIMKTFPVPGEKSGKYCTLCKGKQKNTPILGLEIIQHMICRPGYCSHGAILDPRNGNVYHATMKLIDHGQLLKVRGYLGISLFGKTVIWERTSKNFRRTSKKAAQ